MLYILTYISYIHIYIIYIGARMLYIPIYISYMYIYTVYIPADVIYTGLLMINKRKTITMSVFYIRWLLLWQIYYTRDAFIVMKIFCAVEHIFLQICLFWKYFYAFIVLKISLYVYFEIYFYALVFRRIGLSIVYLWLLRSLIFTFF